MPVTHSIDRARRRLYTRAEGLVTYDDLVVHLAAEEAERGSDLPELFDAREAITNVTTEEIRRLVARAQVMAKTQPLGPTAIVADDPHVYGMARMYAILAEAAGAHVEVFRELDTALAWLEGWIERPS